MKKILSLLLIFILLFLCVGCDQNKENEKETLSSDSEETTPERVGYYEQHDSATVPFNIILSRVTDVVKATYKETQYIYWEEGSYYMVTYAHKFELIDSMRDNPNTADVIVVSSLPMYYDCGYSTVDIKYEKDKNYLLLVKNGITVYSKSTDLVEDSLIIPLNENQDPDLDNSCIYSKDLISYIEDEELKTAGNERFTDVLLEKVKNNAYISKVGNFFEGTDVETVISKTPYLVLARIKEKTEKGIAFDLSNCKCEILNVWKGDLNVEELNIILPSDMVEEGCTYNLAIQGTSSSQKRYELFGFRSVFPGEYSKDDKTDIATLCTEAAYVYVVEVEEKQFVGRDCRIISSLKGEYENEKIYLFVHEDDFEVGKKYVVALDKDKKIIGMTEIPLTTQ